MVIKTPAQAVAMALSGIGDPKEDTIIWDNNQLKYC
jgi:hypothetical protein